MHNLPIIITTNKTTEIDRLNLAQKELAILPNSASPDRMIISETKGLGIDLVRKIISFSASKSLKDAKKTALILFSENLTIQAQNALLKTLEEATHNVQIVLITNNLRNLLPTIRSRSRIIKTIPDHHNTVTEEESLDSITKQQVNERLEMTDTFSKDQEKLSEFIERSIVELRNKMITTPSKANLYNLTLALYTRKLLKTNTNTNLILDNFFIKLQDT